MKEPRLLHLRDGIAYTTAGSRLIHVARMFGVVEAARNLADVGGPASADATRRLAKEYARSLLVQIAGSLERVRTAGSAA